MTDDGELEGDGSDYEEKKPKKKAAVSKKKTTKPKAAAKKPAKPSKPAKPAKPAKAVVAPSRASGRALKTVQYTAAESDDDEY